MPVIVLISEIASAPPSSAALALSAMQDTLGVSLVMTGFTHTFLTASVTLRTLSGCTPKAMPPLRTLGQEILSSTISALLSLILEAIAT